MAKFRCCEVVSDISTLKLRADYVTEGRIPEARSLKIDCPGRILGRVAGIGFMGDFRSENGRWYPTKLWQQTTAADYVLDQIDKRLMFGTCGHPDSENNPLHPVQSDVLEDFQIGDGTNSHVITKLDYSNDPTGIIEFLILDSDWGRNLYAAYAAGSRLSVSSRAMADYIPGQYHDGDPIMDPDQYWLDTFDVVRVPGIAIASPDRIELCEAIERKITKAESAQSKIQVPVHMPESVVQVAQVKHTDIPSIIW